MAKKHAQRGTDTVRTLETPLTVAEAAAIARCSTKTVRRWLQAGCFSATRPVARGSGRLLIDRRSFYMFVGGSLLAEEAQP